MGKNRFNQRKWRGLLHLQFKRMQVVIVVFFFLVFVLCMVQRNVIYQKQNRLLEPLDQEVLSRQAVSAVKPECLYIWQDDAQGVMARDMTESMLSQMKVPYKAVEIQEIEKVNFRDYQKVVIGVTDLDTMGDSVWDLMDWIDSGGNALFLYLPSPGGFLTMIQDSIGIDSIGATAVRVEGFHFLKPLMPGGESRDFYITDPYESSWGVLLKKDCQVYMESVGSDVTPLIWRYRSGDGVVVVGNIDFIDKIYRGFYCAAYTLLGDGEVYPVINGSSFYIDDFPAPVPGGDGKYITRDFGVSVKDFMTQIWWPDVQKLGQKHNIRFTGMVIEQYSDQVEGDFTENEDISRYRYFGNQLLDSGGEIGFHGYNHMPLVLKNFDYRGQYDSYQRWGTTDDMKASLTELDRFCGQLFPDEEFQVYVPPSNILSEEGRQLLVEEFPQIKVIASTYLAGDLAYVQEFEVAEDGMVETPRIISGYIIDDYTWMTGLGELTFHYVNTHFQHPDDVLDEDRGAELGWNEMYRRLDEYADWLYDAAPPIRNLTGIEMAGAVQRYDAISVDRTFTDEGVTLELGNFADEAWFMVRLNGHEPGKVTGGTLEKLLDGLYLLKAEQDKIEIPYQD